ADVVEVVAQLGDTIIAVAHGPSVTVGESGDIFAPATTTSFTLDALTSPVALRAGLLTIHARRVPASAMRVPRERFDGRPAAYIGISLLVHLALWGTSMRTTGEYGRAYDARYALALPIRASGSSALALPLSDASDAPAISMSLGGVDDLAVDLAGDRVGDLVGHASVDIASIDDSVEDLEARRARAIASVQQAGFLGADALRGEHSLGDIPGTGQCTHEPCASIGAGPYDTACRGECGQRASGGVGQRPRVPGVPVVHLCGRADRSARSPCIKIVGELDKAIIRRYIRRTLPAITGCYEKQLLIDGTLSGAVETSFVIDPMGHTRDITATGMHPEIASCIASVISTIQFPRSKGGGSTRVHYPFSFFVAGG
ncbi:MAG: AgmX/PglI C-terminal domain-containing protein, partial [Kofleriaceae bacterium]